MIGLDREIDQKLSGLWETHKVIKSGDNGG